MQFKLRESSKLYKGIFWITDAENIESNKKYCFQIPSDSQGNTIIEPDLAINAKSGDTYNHEATWAILGKELTHNKPYDYYPRGRVQISNGKAIVYMNPNINTEKIQKFIKDEFNLNTHNGINKIVFNSDGSEHYKCYLDK